MSESGLGTNERNLDSGTYAGKNHGLKHAKGEFITFMDSDDWQHPQKIEKIIGNAWTKILILLRDSNRMSDSCLMGNWRRLGHGSFANASWERFGRGNTCWKPLVDSTKSVSPLIPNCWKGLS